MNKKGSMFIETALLFPAFLLTVLSLFVLIRLTAVEENTMRAFTEEGQKVSKEAYLTQLEILPESYTIELLEGIAHGTLLELRMLNRLNKEENMDLQDMEVDRFDYMFSEDDKSGLIRCSLSYWVDLSLPLRFQRQLEFEQRLFFRGFIGADRDGEGMGFDVMEDPGDPFTVYIFPRAGERFHQLDCRMIAVYPRETILSPSVRRQYAPCRLCDAASLPWGIKVYCFDTSGKAYHRGSCTIVERYVTGIDREEAIGRGYSPCSYCGG